MIRKTPKLRLNQEIFLERSKIIHGDKYDYSKSIFTTVKNKITITCPIHGDFNQIASGHMNGQGCKICANQNKSILPIEKFIEKANLIHLDKYNYSKTEYKGALEKICIICSEHGEFWQNAGSHLHGVGCPACAKNHKSTTEDFILKAKQIYKDIYDYSKIIYINATTKVKIICNICNTEFEQKPSMHLQGRGCPTCSRIKNLSKFNWNVYISKGEQLILDWLTENHILFSYQYLIELSEIIRKTNKVYIDFYIEYQGKKYFIEYDGEQHFKYTPHFHIGGILDFNIQLKRDRLVKEYCQSIPNAELIKFTYKDSEETIINELSKLFL